IIKEKNKIEIYLQEIVKEKNKIEEKSQLIINMLTEKNKELETKISYYENNSNNLM
ncbi:17525_t:CDS:1, partial [Cetraspora pellucida]